MKGEVACAIIIQGVRLMFQPPISFIRAHLEFYNSHYDKISFQPNLTQRRPDWLSDYKQPPGFENNFNGATFHHYFYSKTINHRSSQFS